MNNITISGARLSEILGINPRYLRELANDEKVKKIGQDVSIEKMNKVKILKYDGDIKTKYIQ